MNLQKIQPAADLTDEERALLRAYARASKEEKIAVYVALEKHGMKEPTIYHCNFQTIKK